MWGLGCCLSVSFASHATKTGFIYAPCMTQQAHLLIPMSAAAMCRCFSQATNLLTVARIWRQAFTDAGADPRRIVVVATYEAAEWIPYFWATFKASEQAEVDAIAVVGVYGPRSWSGKQQLYSFNDFRWFKDNTNITYDKAVNLTRSAVIHADLTHNRWSGRVRAQGKRLLALQGKNGAVLLLVQES